MKEALGFIFSTTYIGQDSRGLYSQYTGGGERMDQKCRVILACEQSCGQPECREACQGTANKLFPDSHFTKYKMIHREVWSLTSKWLSGVTP